MGNLRRLAAWVALASVATLALASGASAKPGDLLMIDEDSGTGGRGTLYRIDPAAPVFLLGADDYGRIIRLLMFANVNQRGQLQIVRWIGEPLDHDGRAAHGRGK